MLKVYVNVHGIDLMKKILTSAAAAVFALTFAADRSDARPFTISVGFFDYTIDFYTDFGGTTGRTWTEYTTAALNTFPTQPVDSRGTTTPWFEPTGATAVTFASAFINQVPLSSGAPAIPIEGEAYTFGYKVEANPLGADSISAIAAVYEGGGEFAVFDVPLASDTNETFDPGGSDIPRELRWAYVSSVERNELVPEIDGPVLVQVGFALMGLYVLMLGRRRREDEVDMSQAAA